MFGLFKKKRRKIRSWEITLLRNTIKQLPSAYESLGLQIDMGLLRAAFIESDISLPEFVGFSLNPDFILEFENRKERGYKIKGVKIYDTLNNKQLNYTIYVFEGLLSGYLIEGGKNYDIDINRIDTSSFSKVFIDDQGYKKLCKLLSAKEVKLLSPNDIYEIILNGKSYYHIRDLEDGDFIGMDVDKVIYKITHDPFEVSLINKNLEEALGNN